MVPILYFQGILGADPVMYNYCSMCCCPKLYRVFTALVNTVIKIIILRTISFDVIIQHLQTFVSEKKLSYITKFSVTNLKSSTL